MICPEDGVSIFSVFSGQLGIVSYPDPPISAALGVLHHQHTGRKGLETLARFSCALEEFTQRQWGARSHM